MNEVLKERIDGLIIQQHKRLFENSCRRIFEDLLKEGFDEDDISIYLVDLIQEIRE